MDVKDTMSMIAKSGDPNAIEKKKEGKSLKEWLQVMKPQIAKALPDVITPERFTRIATTALSSSPKLANSTPASFFGALMQAAQLGLEPNTPLGQAYLIPYKNNRKGGITETQFQVGYKGMIDLAHRSGEFKSIYAEEVYSNDEFEYELGLEPKLIHKPYQGDGDRGSVICYYAVYMLVNGGFGFKVMSKKDIETHAKRYSKSYSSGPWQTNFDEMAKKTVIKKLLKYAPIKTEFQRGVAADETINDAVEDDGSLILDSQYVETDYDVREDEEEKDQEK